MPRKNKGDTFVKTYFTPEDTAKRRQGLRQENWNEIMEYNDPNVIYNMIIDKYGHHYNLTKTTKTIRIGSKRHKREPWMTNEILADIRRRDRLAKQPSRRDDYKKLRNDIVSRLRKAEKEYINQQVIDSSGNVRRHWDIIRKATNKSNNKEETTTDFLYQGLLIKDPQANAENMNTYLASIGQETNNSVGAAKKDPISYLHQHKNRNINSLAFSEVTDMDIKEVCKKFTPKTSSDVSGFQQNIVLSDIDILAPALARLVNKSQDSGIFPTNGKIARVIPVYKGKGDKREFGNYRPISLLPMFSKIIERLIYN